ncbi:DUF3617 domain-containing protein [Croceicoccus hydrothermalis]|uniref:DUF3617 domain-containing protein n=1 Tax=Croceicoccus hydrothermalis TaxID=2867964 RepID=UPI001EFB2092|nr:DUF3617 domain-containing protein [Croceicoccus hydrothermalis]
MTIRFASLALCSALVFTLPGCSDDAPTENPTVEQAASEAEKLERPDPGQYRQTITVNTLDMPGAPDEIVAQVRSAIEQNATRTYCLTPEQASEGFADQFRRVTENEDCTWNRFGVDDGDVDALLTCGGGADGEVTIAMEGNVSSTGSRIDMRMNQTNAAMNMDIVMTMESERLGDCAA